MSPTYIFRRYGIPVLMVAAAFLVFRQLAGGKKEGKRGKPKAFVRKVMTRKIAYGTVRPAITASGRVSAWEKVNLTPEVSGIIAGVGFRLRKGMSFAKGDILMNIDNRQASNTLHSTVSDLQNALTALLPELKVDMPDAYDRWQTFFGSLSAENLPDIPATDTEREKLLANRFAVYKLYYNIKNLQLALDKHTVYAPFTGTVEQSMAGAGDMARAGSPAAVLARTDLLEVELALPAADAKYVTAGMKASVTADGMTGAVTGIVHRKSGLLDERMQTAAVFVRVPGRRTGPAAGSYASVTIGGTAIKNAVTVPRKALHDGNRAYVIEDGKLAEKEVRVARLGITDAVVTGGLASGAVMVAEPLQDAVIGMDVKSADAPDPGSGKKGKGKKGGGKK